MYSVSASVMTENKIASEFACWLDDSNLLQLTSTTKQNPEKIESFYIWVVQ